MSEFKREERYIVLKLKNMYELERKRLNHWLKVNDYEEFKTECVVVESDWPIYEEAWDMVQRLAEGREQKIAELQTKLAESEARLARPTDETAAQSLEDLQVRAVVFFVNSMIGAREAGFVDTNMLSLAELHRIMQNHVNDNYDIELPHITKEWGNETAIRCGYDVDSKRLISQSCDVSRSEIINQLTSVLEDMLDDYDHCVDDYAEALKVTAREIIDTANKLTGDA